MANVVNGISVVIPNYNGAILLPQILPTVFAALQNIKLPTQVIVVDDASTDASVSVLTNNFATVQLIQQTTNQGFAPTANNGIYAAQFSHVLLLNSDVKLTPNYFEPLLKYFEEDNNCFGVMGRIIGWTDDVVQDAAKYPRFHGIKIKTTGNYLPTNITPTMRLYSWYLSGANAFVCKQKFMAIGGFNTSFAPFYIEDFELSLRAWRLGYNCYYEHQAICKHKTSTTIKSNNKKNYVNTIYYRNKMFLHFIHLSVAARCLWFAQTFFELVINVLTGKWYYVKAIGLFLANIKTAQQNRQQLLQIAKQNNGLLGIRQVANKITNTLQTIAIKKF
jgi:GT2 family glycosyltransferase